MNNKNFVKILKSVFTFTLITGVVLWLQSITSFNPIYLGLGLIVSCYGIFSLTNYFAQDKDIFKSLDVLFVTINLSAYLMLRNIIPYASVDVYICKLFNISNFNTFITLFSVGYGLAQFGVGYILSKYSGKLLAITGAIVSCCIFWAGSIDMPVDAGFIVLAVHGIMGVLCSAYAVSIGSFIRETSPSPKDFNILINIIFIFAAVVATVFSSYFGVQKMDNVIFNQLTNIIGAICLVGSIYFGIRYFVFAPKKAVIMTDGVFAEDDVSYLDVWKVILYNKQYFNLAIQAFLIVLAGIMFKNTARFIQELCLPYGSNIVVLSSECQKAVDLGYITGMVALISLAEFYDFHKMMILYTGVNWISIMIICLHFFVYPIPLYLLKAALCASFSAHIGHNIPQIISASQEKNKKAGNTMVGIFNSISMLLGATLVSTFALSKLNLKVCLIFLLIANIISFIMSIFAPKHL